MSEAPLLHCPIRGPLRVTQRASDSLTFTEEKQRIDAIRYLLYKNYPSENIGIETTLFKLGHKGKNSFRTDFAVYDAAFDDLRREPLETRLNHLKLIAEIKRDHRDPTGAKATQVQPALRLVPALDALGVYWDDVEQRFFFKKLLGNQQEILEAPISKIPSWGNGVDSVQLRYADLDTAANLVRIFDELENALHPHVVDKTARYSLIQQLLLTKIHDENLHQSKPDAPLDFQDFSAQAVTDSAVSERMNTAMDRAARHYQRYLPKDVDQRFRCSAEALRNATRILAPLNILRSRTQVIQAFYMKFAKSLYKWDLAQYFTPHEVIDFMVDVVHPRYGEHVKDPACGSADFLISAFRHADNATNSKNCVWGSDNSPQAVQISILNMVLNGDGKSQIEEEDSLETFSQTGKMFQVVLCNPPFGTKILEKRPEVLRRFSMGYEWNIDETGFNPTDAIRKSQQTGILFAELCVKLTEPGGRIGLILPNGYLGNRTPQYVALREWLLRNARVVGIVAFPRFTFKKSGADVSASAVFLEKRDTPLGQASDSEGYRFYTGLVESVGWRVGDKTHTPIYRRNPETGQMLLDDKNEPILDTDFAEVLDDFLRSSATDYFSWLTDDREPPPGPQSWSVPIETVVHSENLNLDPKRLSYKVHDVRTKIQTNSHFRVGELLELVKEPRLQSEAPHFYKYVEIERIGYGEYDYEVRRGWDLPDRAQLTAAPRDIFIPHVWGCAGKWFVANKDCDDLVVTNGCTRLRFKRGKAECWPDLAVGLCSEAFKVQMRALATGSDGLAEVADDDLLAIVLPRLSSAEMRKSVSRQVSRLINSDSRFGKVAQRAIDLSSEYIPIKLRKSHCSVV